MMVRTWLGALMGALFASSAVPAHSGRPVRRRDRQRHDADRGDPGAAAAAGAGIRETHRRQDQRDRRALLGPVPEGADRLGRAARTPSMPRFLHRNGWSDYVAGGYLEDLGGRIAQDKALQWNDIAPFFPRLLFELRRQDLSRAARWRLPHALLPHRRVGEGRPEAAYHLG